MTNEEARKILIENFCVPQISGNSEEDTQFNIKMQTAFNTAIKALEQEPCEDAISREDLEECKELMTDVNGDTVYAVRMSDIRQLSSVNPQPKTGHWFVDERSEGDREIICSNCEQPIFKYHKLDFDYRPKYCPNCGCWMVEPQESEE